MKPRILTGLRDQVLTGITSPICLRECRRVTIDRPNINGGHWVLIEFEQCTDCHITGGTLSNPLPHPDATPDDACSHHIQFIGCRGCSATGVKCAGKRSSGDAINLWNCHSCIVDSCIVTSKLSAAACPAIIDGPSGNGNIIRGIRHKGHVNICGGLGHRLENITAGYVQVTGEYYGRPTSASLIGVRAGTLYVGPRGRIVEQVGCKFKRVEQ